MAWRDYTETRAIIALGFGSSLIVGLFTRFLTGGEFVSGVGIVSGLFATHSLIDDKFPDRNVEVTIK